LKLTKWIVIGLVVLVLLIIIAAAQILGKFSYLEVLYSNILIFVFSLIAIAILSTVGSAFIGVYISHRYFSTRNFTPFEEEMMKMCSDVKEIKKKLKEIDERTSEKKN